MSNDKKRDKKTLPLSDKLMNIFDGKHVSDLAGLSDDEWDAHDQAVRAARLERERSFRDQEARTRGRKIAEQGAPSRLLGLFQNGSVIKTTPAMEALRGFDTDDRRIMILSGPTGVGKTIAALQWLMTYGGDRPVYLRAADFARSSRYSQDAVARWKSSTATVFDDLGAEFIDDKGSFLTDFDDLIDFYASNKTRMIITTNLLMPALKERYDERVYSRFKESARFRGIVGDDMRGAS